MLTCLRVCAGSVLAWSASSADSFAQRSDSGLDESVAQQRALRFEAPDRGFELLAFSGHAAEDNADCRVKNPCIRAAHSRDTLSA